MVIRDDKSDCSIEDCNIEYSKMLEEITFPKGDPVISAASSLLSIAVDSDTMSSNEKIHRGSASHYYDSSSSSSNTGNSVQTQQYDSGNPIFDNEVSVTNEGSAHNDN